MYQKNTKDGYIVSIVKGVTTGNITEEEYNRIRKVIREKPRAEAVFDYRLKDDLTWEIYEKPTLEIVEGE